MEQLHMHLLRDLVYRLRAGESQRRIARDLGLSRITVRKYYDLAEQHGYLQADVALPDDAALSSLLKGSLPARQTSSLEP